MQRLSIQCLNVALLVLVFIGLPAATRTQWGNWHISQPGNPVVDVLGPGARRRRKRGRRAGLIKSRKERKLCWEWTAVFIGLLFVQYAFLRGCFNFNWLKQTLLWVKQHFP